jgi:hypothetical protein
MHADHATPAAQADVAERMAREMVHGGMDLQAMVRDLRYR